MARRPQGSCCFQTHKGHRSDQREETCSDRRRKPRLSNRLSSAPTSTSTGRQSKQGNPAGSFDDHCTWGNKVKLYKDQVRKLKRLIAAKKSHINCYIFQMSLQVPMEVYHASIMRQ